MKSHHHMCMSVDGPLATWTNKMFAKVLIDADTGRYLTAAEARAQYKLWRHEGKRVVPMGEPCEGFSYETGCPGHPLATDGEQ